MTMLALSNNFVGLKVVFFIVKSLLDTNHIHQLKIILNSLLKIGNQNGMEGNRIHIIQEVGRQVRRM